MSSIGLLVGVLLAAEPATEPAFEPTPEAVANLERAQKALEAAPTNPNAVVNAAVALKLAGRYDDAIALLGSCQANLCGVVAAMAAAMSDDAPEVLHYFEQWTGAQQPPGDRAAAFRFYSQALVRSGQPKEAVAAARFAIAAQDAPLMHLDLAEALIAAGQWKEGEAELDTVLAKVPKHQATLYWKFRCLAHRGDPKARDVAKEALSALTESVNGKLRDRGDLHFLLSEVAAELGDVATAVRHRVIAERLHVTRHWPDPNAKPDGGTSAGAASKPTAGAKPDAGTKSPKR
jgi:tetratricopeptide (TPR) repeat protein